MCPDMRDRLATPLRAQKFPSATSFRIALLRWASASNRLSRLFSRSRSFNRLAWSTFSPPYSLSPAIVSLLGYLKLLDDVLDVSALPEGDLGLAELQDDLFGRVTLLCHGGLLGSES